MTDRMRTSYSFLLIVASYSCLWQVNRSAVLTPSEVSICSGDEIVITCHESNTTAIKMGLQWEIIPGSTNFQEIDIILHMNMNTTDRQIIDGLQFHFEITSYSPLIAKVRTTAHPILNGATVTCGRSGTSFGSSIISIFEIDQSEILWLNVTGGTFNADNLTAIIEWGVKLNDGCLKFTVSLTPSNDTSSGYNITTYSTSYTFIVLYNTNYTVKVVSSSEISTTFKFIKCEQPSQQWNVNTTALENDQISLSCPPGHGFRNYGKEVISTCTSEAVWSPDLSQLECLRDCGQLSSKKGVYTILNDTYGTSIVDSIIEFECIQAHSITGHNRTWHQTKCLKSGVWQPHPQTICGQTTAASGYSIRAIALGVGIPLILTYLCLFGTAAAVLVVKRKRENSKQEDKQSAEDSQNRENHTIEHLGIYSLLAQPDQAGSTRNSAVYAEIGPKAIIPPEGKKGKKEKKGARVVMPDTNVQYAEVKKKPQSTAEQQEQHATGLDMNVILNLDQLLLKLRSQVSPKWRQFGFAVKVPVETLNELTSYQEEQRLSEIAGYWMKQHQDRLTWREVARVMKEIDLNDLAEKILNDSTGDAEENETTQHYHTVAELSSTDLSDEPAKTDTDDNNATTTVIQDT